MISSGIIYLVQHCATDNDEANYPVLPGRNSTDRLSAKGRKRAQVLASYFANKSIDAIYSSPTTRAVQTARAIDEQLDVPVTFCTSLTEADFGRWEGLTPARIMRDDVDSFAANLSDPDEHGYPEGETFSQIRQRALGFLAKLAVKQPDIRTVVITYKQVGRAVLAHLMSVPAQRARDIDQDPGGVSVIRVFRGAMELHAVNYTGDFTLDTEDKTCDASSITPATLER